MMEPLNTIAALSHVVDLIIRLDQAHRIQWIGGRILGEGHEAELAPFIGRSLAELESSLPHPVQLDCTGVFLSRPIRFALPIRGVHHRFEGALAPNELADGCWLILAREIQPPESAPTDRNRSVRRRQTDRQSAALQLLYAINHRILDGADLPEIYQLVVDNLCTLTDSALVWFGERRPDGSVAVVASAGDAADYLKRVQIRWDGRPEGNGPCGRTIRLGEPQVATNMGATALAPWREHIQQYGFRTALSVPVRVNGAILGAITLYRTDKEAPTHDLVADMLGFAAQLGLALHLAETHAQLRMNTLIVATTANGVVITDRNGCIETTNPAFTRMTGYTIDEVKGKSTNLLKSGLHSQEFYRDLWTTVLSGKQWQGEITNRRKDGTLYAEFMTITPIPGRDGEIAHFVAVKNDISERRLYQERLQHLASHDALTGLINRRAFLDLLQIRVATGDRNGTLALLDLDNFALVNEALGFEAGDQVLAELAGLLREWAGPTNTIGYLGQDEFGLLLAEEGPEAIELAQRIRQALEVYSFSIQGRRLHVTSSIGLTGMDREGDHVALLNAASAAVATAKQMGMNTVVGVTEQSSAPLEADLAKWALRVRTALEENRLLLHFQPIIDLESDQILAYEVLLRLLDESGELHHPSDFMPAAERHWLMPAIDDWVLTGVLSRLQKNPSVRFFMNLSPQTLTASSSMERLAARIEACAPLSHRLTLEITETAALRDLGGVIGWMNRMRKAGCQFALDDLGAGFSSFTYLANIPVEVVKIDGAFVEELQTSRTNQALVRAMAMASREIGVKVVAERIESLADRDLLRSMGVQFGQGYAFGRPAPLPEE